MNKETAIRKRKSYILFEKVATAIKTEPLDKALDTVFSILDRRYFGSQTASDFARESLDLLKKDLADPYNQLRIMLMSVPEDADTFLKWQDIVWKACLLKTKTGTSNGYPFFEVNHKLAFLLTSEIPLTYKDMVDAIIVAVKEFKGE